MSLRKRMLTIVALCCAVTAVLPVQQAAATSTTAPRIIRISNSLQMGAHWWRLRAAVRDWNRSPGIRFEIVPPGDGVIAFTEFTEMGGVSERAVWFSFPDGDEVWLNYTDADYAGDPTNRRSTTCSGLGLLVENLPGYRALGPGLTAGPLSSCMDPEAQFTWPLPPEFAHPSALDLRRAR